MTADNVTATDDVSDGRAHLVGSIAGAHDEALSALTTPSAARFDAVVWLSAHLAAFDLVVSPLARRYLPHDAATRRADATLRHEMHLLVRVLERKAAGDGAVPALDDARLRQQLAAAVRGLAARERRLLDELAGVVDADQAEAAARSYEHAMAHGPTRPHPYMPHQRWLNRTVFVLDHWRDRALDILDSRHVAIPLPRRRVRMAGKWGNYLLGSTDFDDERQGR